MVDVFSALAESSAGTTAVVSWLRSAGSFYTEKALSISFFQHLTLSVRTKSEHTQMTLAGCYYS